MKVELMKQNKNTPVVRVASAALASFVLFFSLCVPSFAYTDTSTNGIGFDASPFPVNVITPIGSGIDYNSTPSANYSYGINAKDFSDPSSNLYVFLYLDGGSYHVGFASDTSFSFTGSTFFQRPNGTYAEGYYQKNFTLSSLVGTIYTTYNTVDTVDISVSEASSGSWSVPFFNSLDAGCAALADWINNPPGVSTPAHIAVTLKPGYVGFFDISNLSNVSVSLGTSLFSGAKYPGFSTDQAIGTVSSLPSGSFSLPISGTSSISWAGSGQKDLIGRYSSFSYSHFYTSVGGSTYLVVVNPLSGSAPVLSALGASGANRNGNITVLIDQCRGSKIYSLTESLAIGSGSLDTESNGTSVNDGVYDPDTGAWNFTDPSTGLPEDPSSLPVGGGNDPIIGGSGGNTINEWLEDIANSIKSFFSGAIGAVTTLVSSGSDFIHSLSGLYAWLPGPVYSVLVSALILVITIGVIKVFI